MAKIKTLGILDIDSSLDLDINSSGGTINIANNAVTQGISIGTSAAAQSIKIGNTTTSTGIDFETGTGSFTVDTNTGNVISQLATGEMRKPLQPAFLATKNSPDNNVTGNGATFLLGSGVSFTEIFDQGGDFNVNGTFTAPVTGRYNITIGIRPIDVIAGMDEGEIPIITSNKTFSYIHNPRQLSTDASRYAVFNTILADMDSGDTATFSVTISGGVGNTADIAGVSPAAQTFVSGFLVC